MKFHSVTLTTTVAALLCTLPAVGQAQDTQYGQIKWSGSMYAKFLDGNRYFEGALYNNFDTIPGEGGGDQGQGTELELKFNVQVSKQVEIGGRIHSRFNENFWANYGGFAVPDYGASGRCTESEPRCNQYFKLRGAWALLTPGYDWLDSATIGTNDWGMFDPWTQGKTRYEDRDNLAGFLFQGSGLDKKLRWDIARVTLPTYQGVNFSTGNLFANDANYVGQVKYAPSPDWNGTLIAMYARDQEVEDDPDPNPFNGPGTAMRWDNAVVGLKGQYTGLEFMDVKGAFYYSNYDIDDSICGDGVNNCRYNPLLKEDATDNAWTVDLNFDRLFMDGLSLGVQFFHIGAEYQAVTAARREADVLLTEGQEGTWGWLRPDYNFGRRDNGDPGRGIGYGGWNGETQQVVSPMADNDYTDFDMPYSFSVIGWEGVTLVPKLILGDWEFAAEYSYIDFDTNWQACGGTDKDIGCKYARMDGVHSWGLGGDYRSPYAPYQEREMQIFALKAKYTLDVGNGIDLMARFKRVSDDDDRVTRSALLTDAYDGYPGAQGDPPNQINPNWIPNIGLGGCVTCDDREADYDTFGVSGGYQIHPDLYVRLIYELQLVDLIDGTVDVAPVGLEWDSSNKYGYIEYLTGDHEKNRVGLDFNYNLSGVQFGGTFDYLWGTYDPAFYTDEDGRRVKFNPGTGFDTPVGFIPNSEYTYGQYRMKVWMKVSF